MAAYTYLHRTMILTAINQALQERVGLLVVHADWPQPWNDELWRSRIYEYGKRHGVPVKTHLVYTHLPLLAFEVRLVNDGRDEDIRSIGGDRAHGQREEDADRLRVEEEGAGVLPHPVA